MSNRAKLLLIGIFSTFPNFIFAQSVGIRAGANFSSAVVKYEKDQFSENFSVGPHFGFQAGAEMSIPMSGNLAFQPAVLFSTKGFKVTDQLTIQNNQVDTKADLVLHYIEIPLLFKAAMDWNGVNLFVVAGPYVGIGVGGEGRAEANFGTRVETQVRKVSWGKDDGDFRRMDYGGVGGVGLSRGIFSIGANYAFGVVDVFSNRDEGQKFKNSVLSLYTTIKIFDLKRGV